MSKEEYLQNLQNSVINLKKLLALKELRELKNELNTWEKEIVKKQAALVAEKQSPEARKQQSRDFAKRAEKNFEKAKKTDNEFGTKAYPTESKKSEINESIESSNSGDSQKQDIENLANLRKALASWKEDIENEIEKKSNAEQQRTVRALRAAALRVQQTSDVLESQTLANKAYTNQKSAEAVVQLRDSFRNVFAVLAQETGDTGLVPAEIIMQAKETDAFFQDTSASAETNQAMTFKSNVERLRWKLNKLSLALLKEMGNMRMQMAGMTSQGLGESMSGQGQGEGDKETLQKMGKEQSGKNSELSPEEKAFLEDAAQRMSEQAKRINQLSSRKEIEGTTASKEAKAISEELKAEAERAKTVKRRTGVADLSAKQQAREKKFLNHARSLKQKETESKERESDSAREYNLSPAVRKDDKKPNVSTVIYDDSDISDSKKLFLERFRRNFMQSEK